MAIHVTEPEFKPGNVVTLKSAAPGSPHMTVEKVISNGRMSVVGEPGDYICIWFSEDGVLHRAGFQETSLRLIRE